MGVDDSFNQFNYGKIFEDISAKSGVKKIGRFGMCADVTEFQSQGDAEIYVSDISLFAVSVSGGSLWHFSPNETAVNLGESSGVQHCGWSWGCKFVDLNRDGIQDLFVTSGYWNLGNSRQYIYPLITIDSLPSFLQKDQNLHPKTSNFSHTPRDENCVFQDERLFFGLGAIPDQDLKLRVTWPDGRVQDFDSFDIDQYNVVQEET